VRLADLSARGGIGNAEKLHRRTVTWKHVDRESGEEVEEEFDIWVKPLSFGGGVRLTESAKDGLEYERAIAERILLGDDATEKIPFDIACALEMNLKAVMLAAIAASDSERDSGPKA
jgi:hypothetical protein